MLLFDAMEGNEYIVENINTNDEELNAFLFTLGCYSGEPVTVIPANSYDINNSKYYTKWSSVNIGAN